MRRMFVFGCALLAVACSDASLKTFNAEPKAKINSHGDGDSQMEELSTSLFGKVSDSDDETDELLVNWYVDGAPVCELLTPDTDGTTSCDVNMGVGAFNILLEVSDPGLASGNDSVSITMEPSEPPDVNLVSPYDGDRYKADEPIEFRGTVIDPEEGIEISAWIESDQQGVLDIEINLGEDGAFSTYGDLEAGDHVITLWGEDGSGKKSEDSHKIEVLPANEAPTIETVEITPDPAFAPDTLTCSYTGYLDEEGDADASTIAWSINGTSTSGGTTLTGGYVRGDTVTCTVTPNDGQEAGEPLNDSVVISNTVPAIESVEITPDPATATDALTCTASGFSDEDEDDDNSSYQWTINSEDAGSGTELSGGYISGDEVTCTVTPNDGTEDGEPMSDTITIGNAGPEVLSVEVTPDTGITTSTTLTCNAEVSDPDEDVSAEYSWSNDSGTVLGAGDTLILDPSTTSPGETITCTATVTDSEAETASGSDSVTVGNTAPTIDSVEITPDTDVTVTSTLECLATYTDADGESLTIAYSWTNASGDVLGLESSVLLSADTVSSSDTVTCTATVTDGSGESASGSDSVEIGNSAPSIDAVDISPDPAYAGDMLTCIYTGFADADGPDTVDASTYAWQVNGEDAGTDATLMADLVVDDEVTCTVTPSDGTADGTPLSDSITIGNTAPEMVSVEISPDSDLTTFSSLTCLAVATDADGESLDISYAWTNDSGVDLGTADTITLSPETTGPGSTVTCTATATDGSGESASGSDSVEIGNTAPSIDAVDISPDPATATDTLTCSYTGFDDPDGDEDASTYAWQVNGSDAGTGSTLSGAFVGGDTVMCTVTPSDGSADGTPLSDSITIGNTAPEVSSVKISPDTGITTSTSLTCLATGTDVDGGDLTITYSWLAADGGELGDGDSLSLDPIYISPGDEITCQATITDEDGESASGTDTVTVGNTAPTVDTVEISPDTGVSATTVLTCTASASDDDGDTPTLSYAWDIDGSDVGTGDSLDLSTTGAVTGETVTCTATATDAYGDTGIGTDSVLLENTAPEIDSVDLTPDDVYTNDTVTAVVTTTDAEDDDVSVSYSWYVNGDLVAETGTTLSGVTYFDKYDEVYVVVTPSDASDIGEAATSGTTTVLNSPPTAPEVSLSGGCSSLYFNGTTSSYAKVDSMSDFPSTDVSVEFWLLSSDTESAATVVDYHAGTYGRNNDFSVHNYNNLTLGIQGGWNSYGGVSLTDGDWHHVVVTWQSDSGESLVYKDGVEIASLDAAHGHSIASGGSLMIGQDQDSEGGSFETFQAVEGYVTNVRVYADVLSDADVETRFANGSIDETYLVADYDFAEGTGGTLGDATGHGWDMSIEGATWSEECPRIVGPFPESLVCSIDTESTDADSDGVEYTFTWDVDGDAITDTSTTTEEGDTILLDGYGLWTCTVTPNDGEEDGTAGSATFDLTFGRSCGSLRFDGSDWVDIPAIPDIEEQVTFEMWFKPDSLSGVPAWIDDWYFQLCPGGAAGIAVEEYIGGSCGDVWNLGYWNHVAAAWDFDTGAKSIWINGEAVSSSVASGTPSDTDQITLGASASGGTDGYSGLIGGVRLWSRILSDEEVAANYLAEPDIDSEGLVSEWTFHEGEGSTLTDITLNGFDGTVNGATWSDECPGPDEPAPKASCADWLSAGHTLDGYYLIEPTTDGAFETYCDMTNDDGGWTLVARGYSGASFSSWNDNSALNRDLIPDSSATFHLSADHIDALAGESRMRVDCGTHSGPRYYVTGMAAFTWVWETTTSSCTSGYSSGTSYATEWQPHNHFGPSCVGVMTLGHFATGSFGVSNPWYCNATHATDIRAWVR